LKEYAKQKAEQAQEIEKLRQAVLKQEKQIARERQEARERELKLEAKLQHSDDVDGDDEGGKQKLQDHIREQSKTIFELKETIKVYMC
jgi:hypothetical protein